MKTDLTLNDVVKFLKKGPEVDEIIQDIDALSNLLLLFSPLLFTVAEPTLLTSLGTITTLMAAKDGLLKIGERLFNFITSKNDDDPIEQLMRMKATYVLICYSAFFDTLDKALPKIMKELKLKKREKISLSTSAIIRVNQHEPDQPSSNDLELINIPLDLPHPANPFESQQKQLLPLYNELSIGFLKFLQAFTIWEKMDSTKRWEVEKSIRELPVASYKRFEGQYFVLVTKYEEFFVWANLQEHKKSQSYIVQMSEYMQQHFALATNATNKIDVGMESLASLIDSLPEKIETYQATKAIQELAAKYSTLYSGSIEELVFDDTGHSETDKPQLEYPKKSEIFIPQSFQVLRYSGSPLEDEKTWEQQTIRTDLGTFLLGYLNSPYSMHIPLIILGHPGSGKSLLTNILAARLTKSPFTPIRVVLRNIQANNDIPVQVEEQIKTDKP